jgi:hypothetical protein
MKNALTVLLVLAFSAGLAAQTHSTRRTSRRAYTAPVRSDLNGSLTDLDRIAMSTYADISALNIDRWGSQWRPGFLKSTRQKEAEHTAESVKRNLSDGLPTLIADVRTTHGSVSSTFRLYHDLTLVGEAMENLVSTAKFEGHQHESRGLADDCAALSRIRRNLSSYIEARAVMMDSKAATLASYTPARQSRPAPVKKIVIDDMSQAAPPPAPKKIIVDDDPQPAPGPVATRALPPPKKIIIDDDPEPDEAPAPAKAPVAAVAPQPVAANVVPAVPAAQSQPVPANVNAPAPAAAHSLLPKKIIIDDEAPEAKPARKKAVVQYSNL